MDKRESEAREVLKPCPMCLAPARFVWGGGDYGSVKCTRPSCGTRGGSFAHQSNAVTAWNSRSVVDPEAVKQLCAKTAQCAFDDRPNIGHDYRWHEGYERGCRDVATAILSLDLSALSGAGEG